MGTLTREPLSSFVRSLVTQQGYADFVETGTYHGETTIWAASVFSRVFTVEISPEFQAIAKKKCNDHDNISFLLGRSDERIPDILKDLELPTIFWLDAHAGGGWYANKDDCPLIPELEQIADRGVIEDLIIIDDARGFTAPPPPPWDPDVWPPIHTVLDAIDPRRERYIVIINDMIICAPPRLRGEIISFCNEVRPTI